VIEAAAVPAAEAAPPVEAAQARAVCANCDTPLQGDWCHACGQKAHLQTRLRHLLAEFFESLANFDGRLWRTLPLVAFRPGRLSRSWREGRRVRYVAPLHFFLFAVFLVFLMPELTGRHLINPPDGLQVSAAPGPGVNASLDVGRTRDEIRAASQARLREADQRVRAEAAAAGVDPESVSGAEAWGARMGERIQKATANREAFSDRVEDLASRLSFVLVPISMVILWLLLLFKRGYTLYDHAVVALYGIGFLALLIAFTAALPAQAAEWATRAILVIAPVHAIVHLKGAYALSWPGAVIRGVFLGVFSAVAFLLFLATVVLLGVFA
jgi:hypothetical protein